MDSGSLCSLCNSLPSLFPVPFSPCTPPPSLQPEDKELTSWVSIHSLGADAYPVQLKALKTLKTTNVSPDIGAGGWQLGSSQQFFLLDCQGASQIIKPHYKLAHSLIDILLTASAISKAPQLCQLP